jgi:hypothetical protein
MSFARVAHTATLLRDGRVLVAGSQPDPLEPAIQEEAFNPADDAWTLVPSMNEARTAHTATLLPDGRVLVAGGAGVSSAETYDPRSNLWSLVASMSTVREAHTATLLDDGRVLAVGGGPPSPLPALATAEVFGPRPPGAVCTLPSECVSGACWGGVCCDSACDVGCTSCSIADGAPSDGTCTPLGPDCGPFACNRGSRTPECFKACTTADECAPGFACNAANICAPLQSTFVDDACAFSPQSPVAPSPHSPLEPGVLVLAAFAALRRRVRRSTEPLVE